jgi:hypothetical protein
MAQMKDKIIQLPRTKEFINIDKLPPKQKSKLFNENKYIKFSDNQSIHISKREMTKGHKELSISEAIKKYPNIKKTMENIGYKVEVKKTSKIAESIKTKALEEKITTEFGDLAEFTPTTIKEQSRIITDIMNRDINEAKAIIRGEVPLPQGLNPIYAIKAMEDYAIKTKDGKLMADLANSPLVSESSVAAQTLRMAAERNPDSAVFKLRELKLERENAAKKKLGGRKESQVKNEIKNKIKNEIKKSAPKVKDWVSFIESIKC